MAKASNKKTENLICNCTDSINTSGGTVTVSDETEDGEQNSPVLYEKASDKNTGTATGGEVKQTASGSACETDKQSAEGTAGGATAKPDKKSIPTATNAYPGEKLVRIRIPHAEDDSDVFVSVNDRNWYIKRGSEVEIPECAAEVLIRREERIADAIDYENRLAANRKH